MSDFFKSIFDAWDERIRSPILGSIALVYVIFNWKALFYLLFAETPVGVRLRFFELNTSTFSLTWGPLVLGVALALISPFLKFCGAWCARMPNAWLMSLQEHEASAKRVRMYELEMNEIIAKAAKDAAREEAQLDEARRTREADDIGGDVKDKLEEGRKEEKKLSVPLSHEDAGVISLLDFIHHSDGIYHSAYEDVFSAISDVELEDLAVIFSRLTERDYDAARTKAELKDAVKSSIEQGLIETVTFGSSPSDGKTELTAKGYRYLENSGLKDYL